jgi:hypothetical protein
MSPFSPSTEDLNVGQLKIFLTLDMSVNDPENTERIDFEVICKL